MTIVSKGSVVYSVTPWKLVRLDSQQDNAIWVKLEAQLPKFSKAIWEVPLPYLSHRACDRLATTLSRIQRELFHPSSPASQWCQYVTFTAIHVANEMGSTNLGSRRDDKLQEQLRGELAIGESYITNWEDPDQEIILQAWTLMNQQFEDDDDDGLDVDWTTWCRLIYVIEHQLFIITKPNPMVQYSQLLSTLTEQEYKTAAQVLHPLLFKSQDIGNHLPHLLKVKQKLQDKWDDQPLVYGMLLECPFTKLTMKQASHVSITSANFSASSNATSSTDLSPSSSPFRWSRACLPTTTWELQESQPTGHHPQVTLIALFDLENQNDVLVTPFPGGDVRPTYCDCYRCKFDKDPSVVQQLPLIQRKRLADHCFQHGKNRDALRLYRDILNDANISSTAPSMNQILQEVHHAIGAVYLQQDQFLKAQESWKESIIQHPELLLHEGIALQMEKQRAYGYSNDVTSVLQISVPDYEIVVPSLCFVTPQLVDEATCRQIIHWANTSGGSTSASPWTSQRHYAVPTTDVAVHTVPPLLDWFVSWMQDTVQPLLAHQFQSPSHHRYYCHDAFCVKYEPQAPNSHLPVHCDESTHSLVLSLNNDFEGGGTYLVDYDKTVLAPTGSLLSFRGDSVRHGGNVITKGVRYILAVFLYVDDCHKVGLTKKRQVENRADDLVVSKRSSFSFGFNLDA